MVQLTHAPHRTRALRDLHALLDPLVLAGELHPALQIDMVGAFDHEGVPYSIPRIVF
ncbi:MAG: hypothetical protein RL376_1593, partial [Verrucomicrobiota bacterium]